MESGWNVWTIARPGASRPLRPGELGDQLERALLGAEVGHRHPRVGVDDRGQGHPREVVALGHHLRAEQDGAVCRRRKRPSASGKRDLLRGRVGVDADPLQVGEANASRARIRAAACPRRSAPAPVIRTPDSARATARRGRAVVAVQEGRPRAARARCRSSGSGGSAPQVRQWIAGATPRAVQQQDSLAAVAGRSCIEPGE